MINEKTVKEVIAKRVARELKEGQLVNLGIGLPTMVSNYVDKNKMITFQSENGMVGMGKAPEEGKENDNIKNAGGSHVTVEKEGAFFDSSYSFGLIRGGHVDVTVLGALQVDEKGNVSNWKIPNKLLPGMGGAMDLVEGAKKVIIAMQHTARGKEKILKECNLPFTAKGVVNLIITEYGVMEVTKDGLLLKEINKETTVEEMQKVTGAKLIISEDLKEMTV